MSAGVHCCRWRLSLTLSLGSRRVLHRVAVGAGPGRPPIRRHRPRQPRAVAVPHLAHHPGPGRFTQFPVTLTRRHEVSLRRRHLPTPAPAAIGSPHLTASSAPDSGCAITLRPARRTAARRAFFANLPITQCDAVSRNSLMPTVGAMRRDRLCAQPRRASGRARYRRSRSQSQSSASGCSLIRSLIRLTARRGLSPGRARGARPCPRHERASVTHTTMHRFLSAGQAGSATRMGGRFTITPAACRPSISA